jgi:hypothetical protein
MNINLEKHWWIVPVIAGVVGLLAVLLANQFLPSLVLYALLLLLVLVALSFLWALVWRDIWWAVAPNVWALTAAVALAVNALLPVNNGWIAVLILGAGTFVIAAIPNRRVEVNIAHFVGIVIVVFGFLLSPIRIVWKIVFIVVAILFATYLAWLDREDMKRLFAS